MKIVDFFSKQKNELGNIINMYVCGPTVYDYPHIGNIRPAVIFDIFNRVASIKNTVNYTHNITDIDDKIIKKAKEDNKTEKEISRFYENIYFEDLKKLNILKPTNIPRVTDHVESMAKFVNDLIEKDFAYEVNGSVYFSIKMLKNYGKRAKLQLENLHLDGEFSKDKRNQLDFVLWKNTLEGITFDSKWGNGGRPGWHTECALFIKKFYGDEGIDLHGGGIDLRFPHHVNEMAQYFASTGNELARNWLYIGYVNLKKEKMSKSIGNIIKINDFVKKYSANILRVLLSQTSYTKPIDVNENSIANAEYTIEKIKNAFLKGINNLKEFEEIDFIQDTEIIKILEDNLDTPKAFTHIFNLTKLINDNIDVETNLSKLLYSVNLLGIKAKLNTENIFKYKDALTQKNFKTSDLLRDKLVEI